MNIEGIYYRTLGGGEPDLRAELAAALAICARARGKADAVLLLEACGLLPAREAS